MPLRDEMCDFEKARGSAPITQNVLESVQYLEDQGVVLCQRWEAQTVPVRHAFSIQGVFGHIQVDHVSLGLPQLNVYFHCARNVDAVEIVVRRRQTQRLSGKQKFSSRLEPRTPGLARVTCRLKSPLRNANRLRTHKVVIVVLSPQTGVRTIVGN